MASLLTLAAGGTKAGTVTCDCLPEGLTKSAYIKLTPDRSSVADKLTATLAGRVAVLMVVGAKLNAVRVGGVTSWIWAEASEKDVHKKVATNRSPTFDERSTRHGDLSCAKSRDIGFSLSGKG